MSEPQETRNRWTVKDVLRWTTDYFTNKGIDTARLDAEVLLAHALGVDRLHLYLNAERPLVPGERSRYREFVRRRANREPVALITGVKEFWSIPFKVQFGVLIPRPDTERLVEVVLDEVRSKTDARILEIGAGSGAVAVAILREHPDARVIATDIDPMALETAGFNASASEVRSRLDLVASNLLEAFRERVFFDVICSNPPYIPSDQIETLEPEIRCYEPIRALDGGPDGLGVIRRLVATAPAYLKAGGALVLEVGDRQSDAVREIFSQHGGLVDVRTFSDLAGKSRVVRGRRSSGNT
jgi:release factor glutamine methyltransferase